MRKVLVLGLAVAFAGTAAMATEISFSVQSNESNDVTVDPGEEVVYVVMGWLSSSEDNEGLALVGFDLEFSGGDLGQADTPTEDPMANFVMDEGITNPEGYGGTIIDGNSVQIGGGQNTILNVVENAPFPIGSVITGVLHKGAGVLVTGTLTAPEVDGTYTLSLTNAFANVIQDGEDGDPFWATEAATVGDVMDLTITVGGCAITSADPPDGAIDAGQPSSLLDLCATPAGWNSIDITFTCDVTGIPSEDFAITVDPDDLTPPGISGVLTDGNTVTLMLDGIIPTKHWTIFTHNDSGTSTRLGYLPADVNSSKASNSADVLDVIDFLNDVGDPLAMWQCDCDRSGECNSADILCVIDLLNGADCLDAWNGMTLP